MYQCKAVRTILTVALLIFVATSVKAAPDYLTRPGTIANALLQTDGACVSLDAVKVDKIKARQNPAYFVIVEDWDSTKRLVVDMAPPEVLRMGQTVDVEGELETLPSGERAITSVSVMGYCDRNGVLLRYSPLMKGMSEPAPWPYKTELTAPSSRSRAAQTELVPGEPSSEPLRPPSVYPTIAAFRAANPDDGTAAQLGCKPILSTGSDPTYGAYFIMGEDDSSETLKVYCPAVPSSGARLYDVMGQVRPEGETQVICTTSGPDYDPQSYEGYSTPVADGTIARVKTQTEGVSVNLSGKVVTEVFYQSQSIPFFYIQEQPGALGSDGNRHDYSAIKVEWTGAAVQPGDVVTVGGSVHGTQTNSSSYPECYISANSVLRTGAVSIPPLVGMSQKTTAGGQFGLQPALYVNTTSTPSVAGSGLDHVGIRTKVWGKLLSGSQQNGHYVYYVDDGSGIQSDSQHTGLRVNCWSGEQMPGWQVTSPAQFVEAAGILGAESGDGGLPVPVLRVDSTPPTTPAVQYGGTSDQYVVYTPYTDHFDLSCSSVDPESGIVGYDYAIGTTSGATNVQDWTRSSSRTGVHIALSSPPTPFYVSVRAINGAGLISYPACAEAINIDATTRTISAPTGATCVPLYDKFEATFSINQSWTGTPFTAFNPFCPKLLATGTGSQTWRMKGIYVDAIITKPNGSTFRWPCFYDYDRDNNQVHEWKLRIAPTMLGDWSYQIEVRYRAGSQQSDPIAVVRTASSTFTCVENTDSISKRGFLRDDASDYRFFSFSQADFSSSADDTVFYPFGVKCSGTTDINSLADNGGTYSRPFLSSHMFEQKYTGGYPSGGDTVNDFRNIGHTPVWDDADLWDDLVETARTRGVYLIYLLNDWTYWKSNTDNPYVAQGVASDKDNAVDPANATMREVYKRKLRWALSRWGYSTSIMGFDVINECQYGTTQTRANSRDFHNDMGAFVNGAEAAVPSAWPVQNNDSEQQPRGLSGSLQSEYYRSDRDVDWSDSSIGMVNFHGYARLTYSDGSLFYGLISHNSPIPQIEQLGSQLESPWQDAAVWADRIARAHRVSGYAKPFSWTEYGLMTYDEQNRWTDWVAANTADATGQHAKDWFWALTMNGVSGCHWHPEYFNNGYGNGYHWTMFGALSNYLTGVDFRGMTQESYYPSPYTIGNVFDCSNSLVGVYGFRSLDKAYLYAKNLTSTWYYGAGFRDRSVPTPSSQSASITVKGLRPNTTYTIQRWSTADSVNQIKSPVLTRSTDGTGTLQSFPANWDNNGNSSPLGAAVDYDWAYKIFR